MSGAPYGQFPWPQGQRSKTRRGCVPAWVTQQNGVCLAYSWVPSLAGSASWLLGGSGSLHGFFLFVGIFLTFQALTGPAWSLGPSGTEDLHS